MGTTRETSSFFFFFFSVLRVALGKPAQRVLLMWSSDFILFCFCVVSVCLGSAVCFACCFLCCIFLIVHSVPAGMCEHVICALLPMPFLSYLFFSSHFVLFVSFWQCLSHKKRTLVEKTVAAIHDSNACQQRRIIVLCSFLITTKAS